MTRIYSGVVLNRLRSFTNTKHPEIFKIFWAASNVVMSSQERLSRILFVGAWGTIRLETVIER